MKKSAGHVITFDEFINCATPEVARYFFFRTKSWKHRDFDLSSNLLALIEDYERTERIYFGKEEYSLEKELPDIKRSYELAQVKDVPERYFQVPYSHLMPVVQIAKSQTHFIEILGRTEHVADMTEAEEKRLGQKGDAVRYWLGNYGPEEFKFSVQDSLPDIELSNEQKALLRGLAESLEAIGWEGNALHDHIYGTLKSSSVGAKKGFEAIYLVLLGKSRGPRAGHFLASLDKGMVIDRFRSVL